MIDIPDQPALQARIWGARGSLPTPTAANLGFGGNTSCLQLLIPGTDHIFLFDAGSGIHSLGLQLPHDIPHTIHIFFTHFHWDHLQGLPGFAPLFIPHNTVHFYSSLGPHTLRHILRNQMTAPYFPVEFEDLASTRYFHQIDQPLAFVDEQTRTLIEPFALHHPGGATGYRITRDNATIVYATDHEHGDPAADARLLHAARNADILFYDAQYTPELYAHRHGWGHSTWLEATRLAVRANVQHLVLFHHDPNHTDEALNRIVAQARQHFPSTTAAAEGSTLTPPPGSKT